MIREALNVIQHQLLDNAGKYCAYNTKMSNSATIDFRTLFFSPRTWLGSWEATVNRRTWRHLSGSGSDFARADLCCQQKEMRQHSMTCLFDLYDVLTINVNGSLIIVVNKVIIKALVLDLFQDARIVHLRRRHQKQLLSVFQS